MKYKFSIWRLISSIGLLCTLLFFFSLKENIIIYVDFYSVVAIAGLLFFLMAASFELDFIRFIFHAIAITFCTPQQPNPRFAEIALFASRAIIGVAVFLTLFEVISMLRNMSSPESIGTAISVALLPSLYAILFSELYLAVVYQSFREPKNNEIQKNLPLTNVLLPITIAGLIILVFVWASLSTIHTN
jgi:flagellar motor component MotA